MTKKQATKAEKAYLSRVAEQCDVCGVSPACVHHIRSGQGMGQRASHYLTCGLCHSHHQGSLSIHATPTQFKALFGSELDLLAKTIKRLNQ